MKHQALFSSKDKSIKKKDKNVACCNFLGSLALSFLNPLFIGFLNQSSHTLVFYEEPVLQM